MNWVEIKLGFYAAGTIRVIALLGGNTVDEKEVEGQLDDVKTLELQFDAITEVRMAGGPVALIDLCAVSVSQDSIRGWNVIPGLELPIRLPLTHPDYPCTAGLQENLADARRLAQGRVRYGRPGPYIATTSVSVSGTATVTHGSPIVLGERTGWLSDLAGRLFEIQGDTTAYGIASVVSGTKLILSRPYTGNTAAAAAYEIRNDPFGQLHDCLVHLVSGGPAGRPMAQRLLPQPIASTGKISVDSGSSIVLGSTGTNWKGDLAGLQFSIVGDSAGTVTISGALVTGVGTGWHAGLGGLTFSVAGDSVEYAVIRVISANQLELDRPFENAAITASGAVGYSIFDRTRYTITAVDEASQQLTLDRGYRRGKLRGSSYIIFAALQSSQSGGAGPVMPSLSPFALENLASLNPALAQMLGLYWVDRSARRGTTYDYLIVTDPQGIGKHDAHAVLNELVNVQGHEFSNLDG